MKLATLAVVVACAACSTTSARLDELGRESAVRCVVYEPGFTLCSPFDVERTAEFAAFVREQDALLRELFHFTPPRPWIVTLEPTPRRVLRSSTDAQGEHVIELELGPDTPVHGWTLGREIVVRVVEDQHFEHPDGLALTVLAKPRESLRPLRHELAHAYATAGGWSGPEWFDEGLAHLVEFAPVVDGRIVLKPWPHKIGGIAEWPPQTRAIRRVYDFDEDPAALIAGRGQPAPEERRLAMTLVAFLFELDGSGDVVAFAKRIVKTPRAEIEALEPQWQAWLDQRSSARTGAARDDH
jgi:hypothetical protein